VNLDVGFHSEHRGVKEKAFQRLARNDHKVKFYRDHYFWKSRE